MHKFSCKAEAFVSPSKRSDGLFLQDLRIQRNSRIQDYWEHQFTCELPNLVFLLFSILTLYKGIDHSFFSGTQKSMFQFQAWFSAFLHHWLQKMGVSIHFAKEKFWLLHFPLYWWFIAISLSFSFSNAYMSQKPLIQ